MKKLFSFLILSAFLSLSVFSAEKSTNTLQTVYHPQKETVIFSLVADSSGFDSTASVPAIIDSAAALTKEAWYTFPGKGSSTEKWIGWIFGVAMGLFGLLKIIIAKRRNRKQQ